MDWWVYIVIALAITLAGWAYNKIEKSAREKRRRHIEGEQHKY